MTKKDKLDSLPIGILVGIALPLIIFAAVYFFYYRQSLAYQTLGLWQLFKLVAPSILSLCAIANLLPFYLLLERNKMQGARGMVMGTIILGVIVLILYLLFKS